MNYMKLSSFLNTFDCLDDNMTMLKFIKITYYLSYIVN